MPALSQASSCAEGCVNTQPFAWMWSNYKCFNLQPAQRPGASLGLCEGTGVCCRLKCHVCWYLGLGGLYLTRCRAAQKAALMFPGNWIVALWPSVRAGEPSVQLWGVVTMGIFCTLATNGLFLVHPMTLPSKMGRNYFSSSNLSIALAKWTATHLSLKTGITSMLASIVWFFCPQIKIRIELLQV